MSIEQRPDPPDILEAALGYLRLGMRPIPLHTPQGVNACSCGRPTCPHPGKHPRIGGWTGTLTVDEASLRKWWRAWPDANVGLVTGLVSGIVVLDVDPRNDGENSLVQLIDRHGQLPKTLMAFTGGGGVHYVFWHPGVGTVIKSRGALDDLSGLDVKGDGGMIVAAPSLHERRQRYAWRQTIELDGRIQPNWSLVAPMPEWLITLTKQEQRESTASVIAANGHAHTPQAPTESRRWLEIAKDRTSDGTGDTWGYWLGQQLAANGVTNALDQLLEYAEYATVNPDWPFTRDDAERWLERGRNSDIGKRGEPARSKIQRVIPFRSLAISAPAHPILSDSSAPPVGMTADAGPHVVHDLDALPRQQPEDLGDASPIEPPAMPTEMDDASGSDRKKYLRTEMGNTSRLIDRHGANMRYCKALGWCVWTGTCWRPESELRVRSWAQDTVKAIWAEAADLATEASATDDPDRREELTKEAQQLLSWALRSETDRMIGAMLSLARHVCEVNPACFDADTWLFNCANGTIDLRTGELHRHRRDDYLMKQSPAGYYPDAAAPRFATFLDEIMLERPHLVSYLQRVFGYSLTGDIREQEWYLLVGGGENGKTTLIELLKYVLGDYAGTLEPESLTVAGSGNRDASAPSPDVAALKGKRLVAVTETEEGARLAAARLKKFSGDDELSGRFLHHDPMTFYPEFKLFIYTNYRPQARDTSHAFWRRVRYIPFDLDLKAHPERKEAGLKQRLRAEGDGVLRWLVDGCLGWQRDGMQTPPEVTAATDAYQVEQDVLAAFLADCCLQGDSHTSTLAELYEAYQSWCQQGGERPLSKRKFNQAIEGKGFDQGRTNSARLWIGLGLTTGRSDTSPTKR